MPFFTKFGTGLGRHKCHRHYDDLSEVVSFGNPLWRVTAFPAKFVVFIPVYTMWYAFAFAHANVGTIGHYLKKWAKARRNGSDLGASSAVVPVERKKETVVVPDQSAQAEIFVDTFHQIALANYHYMYMSPRYCTYTWKNNHGGARQASNAWTAAVLS